jgi:hypothetical protein
MGPTAGGTTVVIAGTDFTGVSPTGAVAFGDTDAATYSVDSGTQITATTPAHAADAVQVQVTAVGGVTADTAADDYTYVNPPIITALSPTTGPAEGGNDVVITGEVFVGVTTVFFGSDQAEYTVDSPEQITAIAPPGPAGTVRVQVIAAGGGTSDTDTDADLYTYQDQSAASKASSTSIMSRLRELLGAVIRDLMAAPPPTQR